MGWAAKASATRRSCEPAPAMTRERKARASPVSDVENSGAPQPSTPVDDDRLAGQLGERLRQGQLERVVRATGRCRAASR